MELIHVKRLLKRAFIYLPIHIERNSTRQIYYHDVIRGDGISFNSINVKKFRNQMEYIKQCGFNSLRFSELDLTINRSDECNKVLITFDDGYLSSFNIVYPIMKELNLNFNVFLEVGSIGKENYLTWDMVNIMNNSGLVGFGAHTYSHMDVRYLSDGNLDREIYGANQLIESNTGIRVNDFCFPYGMYNRHVVNLLDSLKVYQRLYTSDGRPTIKKSHSYIMGRIGIENEDDELSFVSKLSGRLNIYYYSIYILKGLLRYNRAQIYRAT